MAAVNPIPPQLTQQEIDRFWSKVKKDDGCWEWQGSRKPNGYAMFTVRRINRKLHVHRLAYFLATGIWTLLFVCHECDNPICARPDHLFEGTQKDNLEDMVAKGRSLTGEKNPMYGRHEPFIPPPDFSDSVSRGLKKLYADRPEKHSRGETHGMTTLTEAQVREIRSLFEAGHNRNLIAERFAIDRKTVYNIGQKTTWKHVD